MGRIRGSRVVDLTQGDTVRQIILFTLPILARLSMVAIRQIYLAIWLRKVPSPYVIFAGYPVGWFFDALLNALFAFYAYRHGKLPKWFDAQA